MTKYAKGANAERELIGILWKHGFASVRAAGSGKSTLPSPDLVSIKKNQIIAFEAKAWRGNYLNISHEQMDELEEWCEIAGSKFYIAWKYPNKGWFYTNKKGMNKTDKAYIISIKEIEKNGIKLEELIHNSG